MASSGLWEIMRKEGSGILSWIKSVAVVFSTKSKEREGLITGLHGDKKQTHPLIKAGDFKVKKKVKCWDDFYSNIPNVKVLLKEYYNCFAEQKLKLKKERH